MNWEALGAVSEIVGAAGVMITLLYLALQIRHASRLSEAQSHTTSVNDLLPFLQWQIQDKDFARIYRDGLLDFESLSPEDRMQFSQAFYYLMYAFKDICEANSRGLMDQPTYEAWYEYIGRMLKMPGGQIWWSEAQADWPVIRERVDNAILNARPISELMPIIWASENALIDQTGSE
jgi:hypothetical protein